MSDDILGAYLAGEATEAEIQQVKDWMNESPENKKLFYEFRLIWNESKETEPQVVVNVDSAWMKFQKLTENERERSKVVPIYMSRQWMKIAAILILLLGGGVTTFYLAQNHVEEAAITGIEKDKNIAPKNNPIASVEVAVKPMPQSEPVEVKSADRQSDKKKIAEPGIVKTVAQVNMVTETKAKKNLITDDCKTKKYVCNSTPCPIEICIIQKGRCNGGRQLPIFNCSIIQPDESGRLCYGGVDEKFYQDCAIAIQEIRIKRVSTGETIVLNQQSSPMTAQEVFSYISGQKKGDIVAGVFQNDCNDEPGQHSLTIENQYGSLMFR